MNAAEIVSRLKVIEPELRRSGLSSLYLFGSRARGDHRSDSDIDLLFDTGANEINLWTRAEIMAAVVDRLGIDLDVDLVDRKALFAQVRLSAEPDLMRVF